MDNAPSPKKRKRHSLEEISEVPEEAGTIEIDRHESSGIEPKRAKKKSVRLFNPFITLNKYTHSSMRPP